MWLGSYLAAGIQKIRIGEAVPQGSHLGTLCFIWFANYVLFYADDLKLFLPVSGFQDCLKIQSHLNKPSE
jgi:hypothetical protein